MSDGVQFSTVRRGFHQGEVTAYLERLYSELQVTATDRDAASAQAHTLANQLEAARNQIDELQREVTKLEAAPTTAQGMSDRLARMLRLAEDEAAEIRANARTEAEEILAVAEQNAESVNKQAHQQAIELAEERETADAEAVRIVEEAKAQAKQFADEAEAKRVTEQREFDVVMRDRRSRLNAELTELERSTREKSASRLAETDAAAAQTLRRARETAEDLRQLRGQILTQLMGIREQLDQTPEQLKAIDGEKLLD